MARKDVDAIVVVGLFERVIARAVADSGRPIEDVATWQVARAIFEVVGGEVRQLLLGSTPDSALGEDPDEQSAGHPGD